MRSLEKVRWKATARLGIHAHIQFTTTHKISRDSMQTEPLVFVDLLLDTRWQTCFNVNNPPERQPQIYLTPHLQKETECCSQSRSRLLPTTYEQRDKTATESSSRPESNGIGQAQIKQQQNCPVAHTIVVSSSLAIELSLLLAL